MKISILIILILMTDLNAKTFTKNDIMCDALRREIKEQMKLVEIYDDGDIMEAEQMQMTISQYDRLILTIEMSIPICTIVGQYNESDSSKILDFTKKYTDRVNHLKKILKQK